LKVLYNAASLVPPLSGIGIYARRLGEEIAMLDEVESVEYFYGNKTAELDELIQIALTDETDDDVAPVVSVTSDDELSNFKKLLHGLRGRYSRDELRDIAHRNAPGLFRLRDKLREELKPLQLKVSVRNLLYHETNFVLMPHFGPRVVTIHDLSVLHYPEFHPQDRVAYISGGLKYSLRNADQVIVDSDFVKQELLQRFKISESKLTTVHLAAGSDYRPRDAAGCAGVLAKHGLTYRGFLLVVGSVEPRKNLSLMIDAYSELSPDIKSAYPMVHIGPAGWNNTPIVHKLTRLAESGWFRSLGYVSQQDIAEIYSSAAGLAFPSIYEGFGLPPLEAMNSGTPVLVSHSSSIPEVVGDCGLLIDPRSCESIRAGLSKLLGGGGDIDAMVQRGLVRAQEFSWTKTAENTLSVYNRALA